jgi:hypothetical protein
MTTDQLVPVTAQDHVQGPGSHTLWGAADAAVERQRA